eukprot:6190685-Pleurochrysis_carterae.AAC.3
MFSATASASSSHEVTRNCGLENTDTQISASTLQVIRTRSDSYVPVCLRARCVRACPCVRACVASCVVEGINMGDGRQMIQTES